MIVTLSYLPLNKVEGGYIVFTWFIITFSYDNWSATTYSLCPQESFSLHFY